MISRLTNLRVNFFLLRASIVTRRLSKSNSTIDLDEDNDYSLSTIMTDQEQIKEGKAMITLPPGAVFYNPAQVFNRDLSIACLRLVSKSHYENQCKRIRKTNPNAELPQFEQFSAGERRETGLRIAEALSATGLRSIRYAKEIPGIFFTIDLVFFCLMILNRH